MPYRSRLPFCINCSLCFQWSRRFSKVAVSIIFEFCRLAVREVLQSDTNLPALNQEALGRIETTAAPAFVVWGKIARSNLALLPPFTSRHLSRSGTSSSSGPSDDTPLDVKSFVITMAPKFKDGDVVFAFSGKWVSWVHTVVAYGQYNAIVQSESC